jgi:hypothetical protein
VNAARARDVVADAPRSAGGQDSVGDTFMSGLGWSFAPSLTYRDDRLNRRGLIVTDPSVCVKNDTRRCQK